MPHNIQLPIYLKIHVVAFCHTSGGTQKSNQSWTRVLTSKALKLLPSLTGLAAFADFSIPKATFTQYL